MKAILAETISVIAVSLFWALALPSVALVLPAAALWRKGSMLVPRPPIGDFRSQLMPASRYYQVRVDTMIAEPVLLGRIEGSLFGGVCAGAAAPRSLRDLLMPMLQMASESAVLRADSLGYWRSGEDLFFLPRFVFQRTKAPKPRIRVGIFGGLRGDESGSALGIIELIRALHAHPPIGREYQLWLYPVCNPSGYADRTRESRAGQDLNCEFWRQSAAPEVRLLEGELYARRFNVVIALDCDGSDNVISGSVNGTTMTEYLLKPALAAAFRTLQPDGAGPIYGFRAVERKKTGTGTGQLVAPADERAAPLQITLQTPRSASPKAQAHAFLVALHEILASYRRMAFTEEA